MSYKTIAHFIKMIPHRPFGSWKLPANTMLSSRYISNVGFLQMGPGPLEEVALTAPLRPHAVADHPFAALVPQGLVLPELKSVSSLLKMPASGPLRFLL